MVLLLAVNEKLMINDMVDAEVEVGKMIADKLTSLSILVSWHQLQFCSPGH